MRHEARLDSPPIGPLAHVLALIEIACATEDVGWDGVFVWDCLIWPDPNTTADPWNELGGPSSPSQPSS